MLLSEGVISSDMERFVSKHLTFLDPEEYPPPRGVTLILLTKGGKPVLGKWGDDCEQWLPLPKKSKKRKRK